MDSYYFIVVKPINHVESGLLSKYLVGQNIRIQGPSTDEWDMAWKL